MSRNCPVSGRLARAYTRAVSDSEQQAARPGRSVGRIAVAVASVLTLAATAGSAVAWAGLNKLSGNVKTIDVAASLGTDRPTPSAVPEGEQEPLTILVMGTDTRTGQGGGFGNAADTASGNGHSDTTILLHVAADRSRALAVSIPRDSWVTRPQCDGSGTSTGRFNEAFAIGGPACTIRAVESLTGVRVDHFLVVDFKGFKAVVDSLGGVPVCLAEPVDDEKSGLKLSKGTHVLDGDQALAFARARKTLGDGSDIARIDRQQVFLSSVMRTALSKNVLTDLPTLYGVLDAVTQSLTTDKDLGNLEAMKDLAVSLQGLSPSKVTFMTVPWTLNDDLATVSWNETKAKAIWASMKNDTQYPPAVTVPPGEKALTTAPSKIRVTVLNGSGVDGAARKAAQELEDLGFVVVGIDTAPNDVTATTVTYDPRYDGSARTLVWSSKATVRDDTGKGSTLVLTIGPDWDGARAAVVKATGSTGTTTRTADENPCVG
jgi:LCP family protein required for cell wall assembly